MKLSLKWGRTPIAVILDPWNKNSPRAYYMDKEYQWEFVIDAETPKYLSVSFFNRQKGHLKDNSKVWDIKK